MTPRPYSQAEHLLDPALDDHVVRSAAPTTSSAEVQQETRRSLFSCGPCEIVSTGDVLSSQSTPARVVKNNGAHVERRFSNFPCDAIYTDARGVPRNVPVIGVEADAGGEEL